MLYTVRYAHLYAPSDLELGVEVHEDDLIGTMGTSGQSRHNHLHIDVVNGFQNKVYRLKEMGKGKRYTPNEKQLNYFNDEALFHIEPVVTTEYMSESYKEFFGKDHPALDIVPKDRHRSNDHFKIYWNRTKIGIVLKKGYDKKGYGNYIMIGFEG